MISWLKILNYIVLTFEVLNAVFLIVISFRTRDVKVHAFAAISASIAGLELASKIAYITNQPVAQISMIKNIILHIAIIANIIIYSFLVQKKAFRVTIVVFTVITVAIWLLIAALASSGQQNAAMYVDQLTQLLLLASVLLFIWERLSIRYAPDRKDDFWLWVSIALLFNTVTGIPFLVLFNYLTVHYSEFSQAQIYRMSNLQYLTSCVYYLLLIRASYEYR